MKKKKKNLMQQFQNFISFSWQINDKKKKIFLRKEWISAGIWNFKTLRNIYCKKKVREGNAAKVLQQNGVKKIDLKAKNLKEPQILMFDISPK